MSFIRSLDMQKLGDITGYNLELFTQLKADIYNGSVFPAVRKEELHFYYRGGCLFKWNGRLFARSKEYERYSEDAKGLSPYEKAKQQIENKFQNVKGVAKERKLLDRLYKYTFCKAKKSDVVVLDIEIRLNGNVGGEKKCDMVLLNVQTNEIMFVEGKVFSDSRVNSSIGNIPQVIEQVKLYTAAIAEQSENIEMQYCEHIQIVNKLFGTAYNSTVKLIKTAKLLVFETPIVPSANGNACIREINKHLGCDNVVWFHVGEESPLEKIWSALCK